LSRSWYRDYSSGKSSRPPNCFTTPLFERDDGFR
jgi:hypothetical protein